MDDIRMNAILDRCVQEGRIAQASRAAWAGKYANDPAGTEAVLAKLTPTPIGRGVLGHGDHVDATLAAGRALVAPRDGRAAGPGVLAAGQEPVQAQHLRPAAPQEEQVELTPENVQRWTHDLFPETRAGAGAGATQGRITRDAVA